MPATFDTSKEEDVVAYLENLDVEYKFGCFKEKNPVACDLLGDFFSGIQKDYAQAFRTYRDNCLNNDFPLSCHKYATYLMRGKECQKDWDAAAKYFSVGCHQGTHGPSCEVLGQYYHGGSKSVGGSADEDVPKAIEAFRHGCEKANDPECCWHLSGIYIQGAKVERDYAKAAEISTRACDELRHPPSCVNISRMYRLGLGVEQSDAKSEQYKQTTKDITQALSTGQTFNIGRGAS